MTCSRRGLPRLGVREGARARGWGPRASVPGGG